MAGFLDRLTHDADRGEYRDGAIRYLLIRPDTVMGILRELPDAMRPAVLAAFVTSTAQAGGRSAATYRDAGAADADALIATIIETSAALGWGAWQFTRHDDFLDVTVANSPFAEGHGPAEAPVCHHIAGILTAVGAMVFGQAVTVRETACAAVAACGACRFFVEVRKEGVLF